MSYVGKVRSLLQSVDSHVLWEGLTDGLPSTLGSARSRFERDRTSLRCPPICRPHQCVGVGMIRRRDCLMTPHFPIWSFGSKIESVDGICHQTDSMNRFYLDVKTGPNTGKTASKPPQIGATSIYFQVVMLHIAHDASIMPQSNLALLPPAYATSHASKGHLCYRRNASL